MQQPDRHSGGDGAGPGPELHDASDQEVVAEVLVGDRDAYALLIERHQGRIFHAMWRMTGNRGDAEELTQEVFCRTYFALASYKPEYRFTTWLYQIASNLAITFLQRRTRESPPGEPSSPSQEGGTIFDLIPDSDPDVMPEQATIAHDEGDRLWQSVAELPPDFREVLVMRHCLELSYEEIRQATGLPIGTVKSRLLRARRRLATKLQRLRV